MTKLCEIELIPGNGLKPLMKSIVAFSLNTDQDWAYRVIYSPERRWGKTGKGFYGSFTLLQTIPLPNCKWPYNVNALFKCLYDITAGQEKSSPTFHVLKLPSSILKFYDSCHDY